MEGEGGGEGGWKWVNMTHFVDKNKTCCRRGRGQVREKQCFAWTKKGVLVEGSGAIV